MWVSPDFHKFIREQEAKTGIDGIDWTRLFAYRGADNYKFILKEKKKYRRDKGRKEYELVIIDPLTGLFK